MKRRTLTGEWFLKKRLFGYTVMVETRQSYLCEEDQTFSPEFTVWERAKAQDLIELNIKVS